MVARVCMSLSLLFRVYKFVSELRADSLFTNWETELNLGWPVPSGDGHGRHFGTALGEVSRKK